MAITTTCCLNLSNPPSPSSKTTQVAWHKNEKWRKECVVGMACMIIGLQMSNLEDGSSSAIAKEMIIPVVAKSEEVNKVPRWSDKRTCPPWRVNSLETIVPENLPRPAARRRWESVRYSKNAPVVKLSVVRSGSNCFSM